MGKAPEHIGKLQRGEGVSAMIKCKSLKSASSLPRAQIKLCMVGGSESSSTGLGKVSFKRLVILRKAPETR